MSDRPRDPDDLLRTHGGAPDHLPTFAASLTAALDDADREMGRESAGGRLRRRLRLRLSPARRPAFAAAAAAAIVSAVAAVMLFGIPGTSRVSGPEPVSAAEALQRALNALSQCETLQADCSGKMKVGTLPDGSPKYAIEHSRLLARADGSFRETLTDPPQTDLPLGARTHDDARDTAYDAVRGVYRDYMRVWDWEAGPHGRYINRCEITTGYPVGQPDFGGADVGATARALQAGGDASVETSTVGSRPVWVISISTEKAIGFDVGQDEIATVTIDQESCLPIRFQLFVDGELVLENHWSNVRIDVPLPDTVFTFAPPEGVKVVRTDAGFRRMPVTRIPSAVAYVPVLPSWVPGGYGLARTAVADEVTTDEGPTSGRDVVAVEFRRGFDSLTVTTRVSADPERAAEFDPIDEWSWADLVARDVRLTAGAFAGVTARVVVAPRSTAPHLYAVKDGILLTVAGGASAEELVAVAQSLQPYDPD